MCTCSKKAKFFCTISVGKNCRDGSNTLLSTDQQEYQILGLDVMIESHDVIKIMDFILFPLQIIVFYTDYSFFSRLLFSLECRPILIAIELTLKENCTSQLLPVISWSIDNVNDYCGYKEGLSFPCLILQYSCKKIPKSR